jgi:hypothetical protein
VEVLSRVIDGALNVHFQKHLPLWHWMRVENSGIGRGVPDMNGCYQGTEVWLELKATAGWVVQIEPWQAAWAERRARVGGRVFFVVRRHCKAGPRRKAADELFIYGASQARALRERGLKRVKPLGYWPGPHPADWAWSEIEKILLASPRSTK